MSRAWDMRIELTRAVEAVLSGADLGLDDAAQHVLTASNRVVPKDTGDLERSGKAGLTGRKHEAAITYTDPSAVPAHERMDVRPANGRERKFLESSMNRERTALGEIVAAQIRRSLGAS